MASEDCNCRCGVSRDFITKAEYAKISGKKAGEIEKQRDRSLEENRNGNIRSITKITPEAIDRVEMVSIPGYTDGKCKYIQQQHKELLETAMLDNDSREVAFIYSRDFRDRRVIYGGEKRIDLNTDDLKLKNVSLFVMHNHPKNSSFSRSDVVKFLTDDNIKTLSIVKNNGGVEVITKQAKIGIKNLYHYGMKIKILKNISSEQALNQLQKERIIKWVK